jgi:hypothetical protein
MHMRTLKSTMAPLAVSIPDPLISSSSRDRDVMSSPL